MSHLHVDHWNGLSKEHSDLFVNKIDGIFKYTDPHYLENVWRQYGLIFQHPVFELLPDFNLQYQKLHKIERIHTSDLEINPIFVQGHTQHDVLYHIKITKKEKVEILHINDYYPSTYSLNDPNVSNYKSFLNSLGRVRAVLSECQQNIDDGKTDRIFLVWSHKRGVKPPFIEGFKNALKIIDKAEDQIYESISEGIEQWKELGGEVPNESFGCDRVKEFNQKMNYINHLVFMRTQDLEHI